MQNKTKLALVLAVVLSMMACKQRQAADQSLVRDDAAGGDAANLAALLATIDASLDEAEAARNAAGAVTAPEGAALDETAEATPETIMALARELEALTANDAITDRAKAKDLVIKLQVLSRSVGGGGLTPEQSRSVDEITTRVRILMTRRTGSTEPVAQAPEVERPVAQRPAVMPPTPPDDLPNRRTVGSTTVECVVHPSGNRANKRNWAVRVNGGGLIAHENGFHEMMTEAHCYKALRTIKNGLICVGRCSDCPWANSNGLYRLADQRGIGRATEFSNDSYDLCFDAIKASTATEVCGITFSSNYEIHRYTIATGAKKQTYTYSTASWRQCLADLR